MFRKGVSPASGDFGYLNKAVLLFFNANHPVKAASSTQRREESPILITSGTRLPKVRSQGHFRTIFHVILQKLNVLA